MSVRAKRRNLPDTPCPSSSGARTFSRAVDAGGTGLGINSPPTRASASLGPSEQVLSPSLMRGKNFGIAAASSLRHVRQLRRVEITRPGADFCKGEAGELLVERVMPSRWIETTKLSLRSQAAPVHAQCARPGEIGAPGRGAHRQPKGGAAEPISGRPDRAGITRLSISASTSAIILRMTSDLLRRVGAALYGQHWHSELAHDLGVLRRTVQRWAAGDAPIPPTARRNLSRLVAARQDELGKLYRELASS